MVSVGGRPTTPSAKAAATGTTNWSHNKASSNRPGWRSRAATSRRSTRMIESTSITKMLGPNSGRARSANGGISRPTSRPTGNARGPSVPSRASAAPIIGFGRERRAPDGRQREVGMSRCAPGVAKIDRSSESDHRRDGVNRPSQFRTEAAMLHCSETQAPPSVDQEGRYAAFGSIEPPRIDGRDVSDTAFAATQPLERLMDTALISSPCIGVCRLDPKTGICVGCLRTGEEIMAWPGADTAERMAILSRLPSRTHRVDRTGIDDTGPRRRRVG